MIKATFGIITQITAKERKTLCTCRLCIGCVCRWQVNKCGGNDLKNGGWVMGHGASCDKETKIQLIPISFTFKTIVYS